MIRHLFNLLRALLESTLCSEYEDFQIYRYAANICDFLFAFVDDSHSLKVRVAAKVSFKSKPYRDEKKKMLWLSCFP